MRPMRMRTLFCSLKRQSPPPVAFDLVTPPVTPQIALAVLNASQPPSLSCTDRVSSSEETSYELPTPPTFPNFIIPDIYITTPDEEDGTASYSYRVLRAAPYEPQAPDLNQLHEALSFLESLTESTPTFGRVPGKALEEMVVMPKKKLSNSAGLVVDTSIVRIEGPEAAGPSRASTPSTIGQGTYREAKPLPPVPVPGFSSEGDSPLSPLSPTTSDSFYANSEPFSFLDLEDRNEYTVAPKPLPKRPNRLSNIFTRRQSASGDGGLQGPYLNKVLRFSTHSLTQKRRKRSKVFVVPVDEEDVPSLPTLPTKDTIWRQNPSDVLSDMPSYSLPLSLPSISINSPPISPVDSHISSPTELPFSLKSIRRAFAPIFPTSPPTSPRSSASSSSPMSLNRSSSSCPSSPQSEHFFDSPRSTLANQDEDVVVPSTKSTGRSLALVPKLNSLHFSDIFISLPTFNLPTSP